MRRRLFNHATGLWLALCGLLMIGTGCTRTAGKAFSGHSALVADVGFTPDGAHVVSGSWDKTVRLWDTGIGQEIRRFDGHTAPVIAVAVSPDGSRIASGGQDFTLRVWDVSTGKQLQILKLPEATVGGVAFSPDGNLLVCANSGKLYVFDSNTYAQLNVFDVYPEEGHDLSFSQDSKQILTVDPDRGVFLRDLHAGKAILHISGWDLPLWSAAISPDGREIISAGSGETKRWDAATGGLLQQLNANQFGAVGVTCVRYSPDGRRVATSGGNNSVWVWDTTTWMPIVKHAGDRLFGGDSAYCTHVAFSPDGDRLVAATSDGKVRVWNLDWRRE